MMWPEATDGAECTVILLNMTSTPRSSWISIFRENGLPLARELREQANVLR